MITLSLRTRLEPFMVNGVVSLKQLKETNYILYVTVTNPDAKNLLEDINILDDVNFKYTEHSVYTYIKYYFGDTVDITILRRDHWNKYIYITENLGSVKSTLSDWGFDIYYSSRDVEVKLKQESSSPPSRKIYNMLYYEAKKRGITVKELRKRLKKTD